MEKQTASPIAGAPANGSHTPDKPKNASEHRKVSILIFTSKHMIVFLIENVLRKCSVCNSFGCNNVTCHAVCKLTSAITLSEQDIYIELFILCSHPNPSWKNVAEQE